MRDSSTKPITLYAYREYKEGVKKPVVNTAKSPSADGKAPKRKVIDSTLKVSTNFTNNKQDFQKNLELTFSDSIQKFDTSKFHFTDTNYIALPGVTIVADTSADKVLLKYKWKENTPYKLVIEKDAVSDSAGFILANNDTISFLHYAKPIMALYVCGFKI